MLQFVQTTNMKLILLLALFIPAIANATTYTFTGSSTASATQSGCDNGPNAPGGPGQCGSATSSSSTGTAVYYSTSVSTSGQTFSISLTTSASGGSNDSYTQSSYCEFTGCSASDNVYVQYCVGTGTTTCSGTWSTASTMFSKSYSSSDGSYTASTPFVFTLGGVTSNLNTLHFRCYAYSSQSPNSEGDLPSITTNCSISSVQVTPVTSTKRNTILIQN